MTLNEKLQGIEERINYIIDHERPSEEIVHLIHIMRDLLSKAADEKMIEDFYQRLSRIQPK